MVCMYVYLQNRLFNPYNAFRRLPISYMIKRKIECNAPERSKSIIFGVQVLTSEMSMDAITVDRLFPTYRRVDP